MARKDGRSTLRSLTNEGEEVEVVRVFVRLCKDEMGKNRDNCRELRFRVPEASRRPSCLRLASPSTATQQPRGSCGTDTPEHDQ